MMKTAKTILVFIMVLLLTGCIQDTPGEGQPLVKPGDKLPSFCVEMSDGRTVTPADLEGAPALTVLFTTGCSDCRRLLPQLEEVWRAMPGLQMVLISRRETAENLSRYWEENGLTMPWSAQPDDAVFKMFASSGVPRVYLTDREGVVVKEWNWDPVPQSAEIIAAVEALE